MKVLHLGAGNRSAQLEFTPTELIVNDIEKLNHVNWCYDLNRLHWPFDNESFDLVYAHDILEHLDDTRKIFEEMIRVCKKQGQIDLQVPMHGSLAHATDITHQRGFAENSFGHFIENHPYCQGQPYFSGKRIELIYGEVDRIPLKIQENGFILPIDQNRRIRILLHQEIGNLRFKFKVK